ncbi:MULTISPECIES: GerAB/ArcD/ProY family transporter [Paenibacillus]|uniref:GerAB/ArcD/ProY family transporter n=1 Tax=Paenibacillus TaxID=44249 RepID=UPI001B137CFD|nr:GerAB/ArcD/ProY family transporter [Paenibacillus lactis]GIO90278.1 germination protein GerKB [Paenibacillus lactis]
MEKIDKYQLIAMTILFIIGSSPLYQLGIEVNQDAWLVMLTGMLAGLLLLFVYIYIQKRNADKSLYQILKRHFGRWIGTLLAIAYIFYFVYESMRNTREFGDIINVAFLPSTPLFLLMLIMILLSGYAVSKGIEVFFRVVEFLLPITLIGYLLLVIMFVSTNLIHLERLLPILENGVMPVIKAAIPQVISFPFGQVVVFLVFWNHLNNRKVLTKVTVLSYLFVGVFLLVFSILNLAILDPTITSISTLPMLRSVRLIQIANFLERLDPIIMMLIYIGIFVKMTAFYMAAVLGLSQLIKMNHKMLTLVVGGFIYAISFISPNLIHHLWVGFEQNLKYHFPIFQIYVPLLLAMIIMLRSLFSPKRKRGTRPSPAAKKSGQT